MAQRPCAACGKLLPEGYRGKTCDAKCRKRLARQKAAQRRSAAAVGGQRTAENFSGLVDADEALKAAQAVLEKELTPIVREAITDDVIRAIAALGKLTPALVESLAKDLTSSNDFVRTRAQAIIAKYTLGQAEGGPRDPRLVINLGQMPDPSLDQIDRVDQVESVELRECESCGEAKPLSDFDGDAPRCRDCQRNLRTDLERRYA